MKNKKIHKIVQAMRLEALSMIYILLRNVARVVFLKFFHGACIVSLGSRAELQKDTDDFYVFGSGPSLNTLSNFDLCQIKNSYSVGINSFLAFDFEPDYILFEFSGHQEPNWRVPGGNDQSYAEVLSLAAEDYAQTTFIERVTSSPSTRLSTGYTSVNRTLRERVKVLPTVTIFTWTRNSLIRSLHVLDLIYKIGLTSFLVQGGASVLAAISLGVSLKKKNIILCGVDLKTTEYFWESKNFSMGSKYGIPAVSGQLSSGVHSTNDPLRREVIFETAVLEFKNVILKPRGITLWVASRDSALFPMLPLWRFDVD